MNAGFLFNLNTKIPLNLNIVYTTNQNINNNIILLTLLNCDIIFFFNLFDNLGESFIHRIYGNSIHFYEIPEFQRT